MKKLRKRMAGPAQPTGMMPLELAAQAMGQAPGTATMAQPTGMTPLELAAQAMGQAPGMAAMAQTPNRETMGQRSNMADMAATAQVPGMEAQVPGMEAQPPGRGQHPDQDPTQAQDPWAGMGLLLPELMAARRDPMVNRLLEQGFPPQKAYLLHYFRQELQHICKVAYQRGEAAATARYERPQENGGAPAGIVTATDPAHLSRAQRRDIHDRVRRGETVAF